MTDTRDTVRGIFVGYCLVCLRCGRIVPVRYGVPPRRRPCRSCGRTGTLAACIATPINGLLELNGDVIARDGASTSPEE